MKILDLTFSRGRPSQLVWVLLLIAAAAVATAGYLHGRLFWEGYDHVAWVGPLFFLNLLSTGVVVASLLLGFPFLFAQGALGISLGAIVSILISHSTSFLGFAEHRYDSRATTIVVAEIVSAVFCLAALALARKSIVEPGSAEGVTR